MSAKGRSVEIEHGTLRGYRQHRYRKAAMCDPCRQAELDDQARRRAGLPLEGQADATATDAQKAWNAGQFTAAQMAAAHGQRRQAKGAPAIPPPYIRPFPPYLPGHTDPAWGEPIAGAELAVGDVLVHFGAHHTIDRFEAYAGSLSGALGDGARTAYSGTWGITVGPHATIRILPREGR